mmetsp:Transcript_10479/g.20954  ORF Transcript_10479/g.20954 Transcript_10479/m.20954 type:complete len:203 (+) Transcript_10479:390-998(+)
MVRHARCGSRQRRSGAGRSVLRRVRVFDRNAVTPGVRLAPFRRRLPIGERRGRVILPRLRYRRQRLLPPALVFILLLILWMMALRRFLQHQLRSRRRRPPNGAGEPVAEIRTTAAAGIHVPDGHGSRSAVFVGDVEFRSRARFAEFVVGAKGRRSRRRRRRRSRKAEEIQGKVYDSRRRVRAFWEKKQNSSSNNSCVIIVTS